MTIKREINGVVYEFKLTDMELYSAYVEQEHIYDKDGVVSFFDAFEDEDIMDSYGMTRKDVESVFDDIAYEMRRNINKYDMLWEYALDEAIRSCVRQREAV